MKNKVDLTWSGDMSFEAEVNGFKLVLDADEHVGGQNKGPRPKPLTGIIRWVYRNGCSLYLEENAGRT